MPSARRTVICVSEGKPGTLPTCSTGRRCISPPTASARTLSCSADVVEAGDPAEGVDGDPVAAPRAHLRADVFELPAFVDEGLRFAADVGAGVLEKPETSPASSMPPPRLSRPPSVPRTLKAPPR